MRCASGERVCSCNKLSGSGRSVAGVHSAWLERGTLLRSSLPAALRAASVPASRFPPEAACNSCMANCLFVATDSLDVFARGLEPGPHRINGDMRRPQIPPPLRLAHPLVEGTLSCIHTRLDPHLAGVAPRFRDVALQALDSLTHSLVRFPLR